MYDGVIDFWLICNCVAIFYYLWSNKRDILGKIKKIFKRPTRLCLEDKYVFDKSVIRNTCFIRINCIALQDNQGERIPVYLEYINISHKDVDKFINALIEAKGKL